MGSSAAELTLAILRLVQGDAHPPVRDWFLFPSFSALLSDQARARLESCAKPLLVLPLLEAGCIGLWSVASLEPEARAAVERELATRAAYFEAKLGSWPDDVSAIRLQEGHIDLRVDLQTFRDWSGAFYLALGFGMERDADSRTARLTIRPPGGGRRPIGLQ